MLESSSELLLGDVGGPLIVFGEVADVCALGRRPLFVVPLDYFECPSPLLCFDQTFECWVHLLTRRSQTEICSDAEGVLDDSHHGVRSVVLKEFIRVVSE